MTRSKNSLRRYANRTVQLRLATMIGVEWVEPSEDEVRGQFKTNLIEFSGLRALRLIETIANWSKDDPESIASFVLNYSPLTTEAKAGEKFHFPLQRFTDTRQQIREMWKDFEKSGDSAFQLMEELGGKIRFRDKGMTYVAPTLAAFLYADLKTSPKGRLRICRRIACQHPYFIADHRNRQFCSGDCAREEQRESNKRWWQEHGQEWRTKRRDKAGQSEL